LLFNLLILLEFFKTWFNITEW